MNSLSSAIETTHSQDERIVTYLKKKRNEYSEANHHRKETFDQISAQQEHQIFKIPGIKIIKFTHTKIKFSFQPALIYEDISQKYLFYCSLRYLARYKKWIIKREPMPARPLFYKVTSKSIFIEDNIMEIYSVVLKIYTELSKWSEKEIIYRNDKYKRYHAGELSYLDIDSIDEELYFSDNEREDLSKKRQQVLKRMVPPTSLPTRKRKEHLKYII